MPVLETVTVLEVPRTLPVPGVDTSNAKGVYNSSEPFIFGEVVIRLLPVTESSGSRAAGAISVAALLTTKVAVVAKTEVIFPPFIAIGADKVKPVAVDTIPLFTVKELVNTLLTLPRSSLPSLQVIVPVAVIELVILQTLEPFLTILTAPPPDESAIVLSKVFISTLVPEKIKLWVPDVEKVNVPPEE
jgi:hypothetical protein